MRGSTVARRIVIWTVLIVMGLIFILLIGRNFIYLFKVVEAQEVGVQFRGGQIYRVVGPGVYSDFGLFVKLVKVSSQAIPFEVSDPEIITKDKQRIGLVVTGDIFRPGLAQAELIRQLWAEYRGLYTSDELARMRVEALARQSMKVCVGNRPFDQNVIGTSRDELRQCIDDELSELTAQFGMNVANVAVPDVVLSPEVQAALDAIVQSRLATEKAAQDQLKAQAEAAAEQARQEGEIRVEQSRIQEQTRQQTILSQLEQERLQAQLKVIEAQRANELAQLETQRQVIEKTKANELLSAQRDLEINQALAEAAQAKARADVAFNAALAELYARHPGYLQLLLAQANASAINPTDKIIFAPEGMMPTLVIPGPGIVPTVETTP
jgi:hypothetical protein